MNGNPGMNGTTGLRQNLELKARVDDLLAARHAVIDLGATPSAFERQRDTFFHSVEGRLKLREIDRWEAGHDTTAVPPTTRSAELIWYVRPDHLDARTSNYRVLPQQDPAGLHAALTAACGVRGVVEKGRAILLWNGVRIHLDMVSGLGTYAEFEAVLGPDLDEATATQHLATLQEALGIADDDRIACAYADLLGL